MFSFDTNIYHFHNKVEAVARRTILLGDITLEKCYPEKLLQKLLIVFMP